MRISSEAFWDIFFKFALVCTSYCHDWNNRKKEHFQEVDVKVIHQDRNINTTITRVAHLMNMTLTVSINGRMYTIDLALNKHLFSTTYVERIVTQEGDRQVNADIIAGHCYYTGCVQGYPSSTVALSTCNGIIGVLTFSNDTYYIEPLSSETDCLSCRHNIYSGSSDEYLNQFSFVVQDKNMRVTATVHTHTHSRQKRSAILEWPQDLLPQTKILELYAISDKEEYLYYNSSYSQVTARTKTLINLVSAIFQPVDIYIVLVGIEVWTDENMINITISNTTTTLNALYDYTVTSINVTSDHILLITNQGEFNALRNTVGSNFGQSMCTPASLQLVVNNFDLRLGFIATVIANSLGSSFGLNHDNQYDNITCSCADPFDAHCIMWDVLTHPTTYWSSCSIQNLTTNLPKIRQTCLYNVPMSVVNTTPACGNGLVETGEQCDCGSSPSTECSNSCCNNNTCQLIGGAQCAFGRCCNIATCTFRQASSLCRTNATTCDLSEYCSGTNGTCPSDVYKLDNTSCTTVNGVSAFCAKGQCPDRYTQCQAVWQSVQGNADPLCYNFNKKGSIDGNCGFVTQDNYTLFKPCSEADALCGLLQCNVSSSSLLVDSHGLYNNTTYYNNLTEDTQVSSCFSVLYTTKSLGTVPNGASCGQNMSQMCYNQVCSYVTRNDNLPNCNDNGVWNNLDQCHCNVGFAPPDCSQPGNGGSIHSNGIEQPRTITESMSTTIKPTTTRFTTIITQTTTTTAHSTTTIATQLTTTTARPTTTTIQPTTTTTQSTTTTMKPATTTIRPTTTTIQPTTTTMQSTTTTMKPTATLR